VGGLLGVVLRLCGAVGAYASYFLLKRLRSIFTSLQWDSLLLDRS
jgi:hypothetical protein